MADDSTSAITWHLDPWVMARAHYHGWQAEVWIDGDRGPESSTWCLFAPGAPDQTQEACQYGKADTPDQAKADAADAMRAAAAEER